MGVIHRLRWLIRAGLIVWALTAVAVVWQAREMLATHGDGRSISAPVEITIVLASGVDPDLALGFSSRRRVVWYSFVVTSLQLAAKKFGIPADRFHFELAVVLQIVRALMQSEVYDLKDCLGYIRSKGQLFESVLVNAVLGVVKLYERAGFRRAGGPSSPRCDGTMVLELSDASPG